LEKVKNIDQFITINTKINVEVLKGNYRGVYTSRIEDIDSGAIYISIPTNKSFPVPLSPETEIEISFISDKGRFSFKTYVIEKITDKITMLKLSKPTEAYRKELRKYFRVDCRIKAKIYVIDFDIENGQLSMVKNSYTAIIKDISGGGMRVITEAPLKLDQAVEFDLSDELDLQKEVFGKVVKLYEDNDYSSKIEAGIEFISIKENDRDKIIKYVFKRQIELRKM
jgi:c-di-GMP-binding flagellar brake protein YcgR